MSIKHHIIYLGLFCLFFFSCREDSMRVRTIVETAEPILIDGFEQEEKMVTATILGQIVDEQNNPLTQVLICLLYTSPSPRDATLSRMPSSA